MSERNITVGQKASRQKKISKLDVELFTRLTGDKQAIHYDEKTAKRIGYDAPIVQGGITTGLLNAIVAHDLPGEGSVFLNVNWNFRHPVFIGDIITGEVEVVSVREDKPIIQLKTKVINQNKVICLEGTAVVYKHNI